MKKLQKFLQSTTLLLALGTLTTLTSCAQKEMTAENLMTSAQQSDIALSGALETETQVALMQFYWELLQETYKTSSNYEKNIIISPLSITTALAMMHLGADGETLAQIEELLGLSQDATTNYLSTYISSLPRSDSAKFHLANSIWMNASSDLQVKTSFLGDNKAYFQPDVFLSSFQKSTVSDINLWVNTNTNGMIPKIIDQITPDALLYLVNALYFEGEWEHVYTKERVRDGIFYNLDGSEQTVEFMYSSETGYLSGDSFTGFSKSYEGNTYQFIGLLPTENSTTLDVLQELSQEPEQFLNQVATSTELVNSVTLPKFQQDFTAELSQTLQGMGLTSAFDLETANFTKVGESMEQNLYISQILHKTYLQVDELGTRAGAVTMGASSGGGNPQFYKEVHLNRPFVYLIIDTAQSLPLFMGVIHQL